MELMGMPLWAWIVFYILVLLMLIADLKMFGKKGQHEVGVGEALKMTAGWIGVSLGRLSDREVAVDGQPLCLPHALLVLRRRA